MNKKISFPIAIIIIVTCAILAGITVWRYGLIPGIGPSGPLLKPSEKEVTITTDKTEYEQGETMKITVRNNLDKLIWYNARTCPPFCWALQKLENGEWRNISIAIEVVLDLPVSPSSLEPNGQLTRNWDMSIMEDGSRKITETGVYRLFFDYGLSRDSYTDKIIYSKEFTIDGCIIKEPDPDGYLLKICRYLKEHEDTIFPNKEPNNYSIETIKEGNYLRYENGEYIETEVFIIRLDCCHTGDLAYIDKKTNEVIGFSPGDL